MPAWQGNDIGPLIKILRDLPEPPTALFCANDALAAAAVRSAEALGWSVPSQLSVVGIDNSEETKPGDIPLTTIYVHVENLGRESIRCLLRLMGGELPAGNQVTVRGAEWIERGSVLSIEPL